MKIFLIPFSIIVIGAVIGGVLLLSGGNNDTVLGVATTEGSLRKVDLEIKNMFCVGCRASVVGSVSGLPGVVQADADPRTDSGWVIYDSEKITKEQIITATIFQAYPARILADQEYSDTVTQNEVQQIPPEIEQKLNELARALQDRGIQLEPFFQEELDDAINRGYWDKTNNLLDNFLTNI